MKLNHVLTTAILLITVVGCDKKTTVEPGTKTESRSSLKCVSGSNFGIVWDNSNVQIPIVLKNTRTASLQIDGFDHSCSCTSVYPTHATIKPGESKAFNVIVDLTSTRIDTKGIDPVPKQVKIRPITSGIGPQGSSWISMEGQVRRMFTIEPDRIILSKNDVDTRSDATVILSSRVPLKKVELEYDRSLAIVTAERSANQANHQYSIKIKSIKSPTHDTDFDLNISCHDELNNHSTKRVRVAIAANPEEKPVQILPERIAWGRAIQGTTLTEQISLFSPKGVSFRVVDVKSSMPDLKISKLENSNALTRSYKAQTSVKQYGAMQGTIDFWVEQEGIVTKLALPVRYYGSGS
ncbi:DUF1573 domain-containing protein [Singulisphaera sp. Ch08]|uniref:DUF1573 domain-containing protein n=1 Tax=Singulisphaera sp. Ch08 TaxID=3120278 RepID=A0AAU7CL94_9BACT